jgi:hypothetical protein
MEERDPVMSFGIVLPAVAEMMDEQKLSKQEAMEDAEKASWSSGYPVIINERIGR